MLAKARVKTRVKNPVQNSDRQIPSRMARVLGGLLMTLCAAGVVPASSQAQAYSGMLTWHNDTARTGQNLQESVLTTANVNSTDFGKLFSFPVDGFIVAEPLFVYNVSIPSKGTYNVVYVVTENDSVYAFDAGGAITSPLWQDSFINPAKGITPVPCQDTGSSPHCPYVTVIGISGTPVIDPASGTLYLVAATKENGKYVQRLHALDIATGAEKFGGPVVIRASVKGTGSGSRNGIVTFSALHENQRPALLLSNGVVYIGWASYGDVKPFHGWVLAYNAGTLIQTAVLNTTPNGSDGGIWESGGAPATDSAGLVYLQTGNGTFDINRGGIDYGDSFLKLNPSTLNVVDYFTPFNQKTLSAQDIDLGSGAGLVLPTQTGKFPNEILSAGKQGLIYLVNRSNMGKFNSKTNHVIETVQGSTTGYWSSPAYWNGYIYYWGTKDFLSQYSLTKGLLSKNPVWQSSTKITIGSTPAISANGTSNGIVWALESHAAEKPVPPAVLHAYNATNVSIELYNSNQVTKRDAAGPGISFTVPTVINGRVYVGTRGELDVYGLLQ
jgi:hypothetical protein